MIDEQTELANVLLQRLVVSLSVRDWEDSHLDQAMSERKSLMTQVVCIGASAINPLVALLSHPDWAVRGDAALMLGHIKSVVAVQPLLATMSDDDNIIVRRSAASALERIGTHEAVQATRSWYGRNGISAQARVQQKIGEYLIYGETDAMLVWRANELAGRKGVALSDIFSARLFLLAEKPPLAPEMEALLRKDLGIIELTPQDCAYLDEMYQLI